MNLNFSELIKYDFENIEIEVSTKNRKVLKETLKYEDLLPTDEEIKEIIKETAFFENDLDSSWEAYKDFVPDEEKIECFDDDSMTDEEKVEIWDDTSMYDEFKAGNFYVTTNELLNDLINRNEFKNIIRKIIKKEEFDNLYYDEYINGLDYDIEHDAYWINGNECQDYHTIKDIIENIIDTIKEFLEKRLTSNKEIDFINKKNITRMIKFIKDDIRKPVTILDMTKVYNFRNDLLTSSLLTNKLLEWKSDLPPYCYDRKAFFLDLERKVYSMILKEFEDEIDIYYDNIDGKTEIESSYGEYEIKSKDISELNSTNTIELNSIINHYFYNENFILDINKKALDYYKNYMDANFFMTVEKSIVEDKTKIKDRFIKYIRPVILRNSPFDIEWWKSSKNMKEKMFLDFCTKEWHSFEENINPKIKILQELLDKYMMNKDVEVTPMGLLVKSKKDNRKIQLNSLSSGEKKLIVIFMHCLFNEDVPIIIDEPEISLSIIWQENLLPDLLEKTEVKQVIVATHSSAVISNSILDKYIIPLPNSIVDKGGNSNE